MTVRSTAPIRTALMLTVLALLTAGCQVRLDTAIDLREDDTAVVDLTLGIRLEEDLPSEFTEGGEDPLDPGEAEEGIAESARACGFEPDAARVDPYEADGFEGVRIVLDGIPLAAVNCFFSEDGENPFFERFSIVRDGDDFVFDALVANLGQALGEGLPGQKVVPQQVGSPKVVAQEDFDPEELLQELEALESEFGNIEDVDDEELQQSLEELEAFGETLSGFDNPDELFEITVRVTFPGGVDEHNATRVEGSTAIWELDGSGGVLMARGGAGGGGLLGSGGGGLSGLLPFILIGLGVLLVIIILILLLRRRGKGDAPAAAYGVPGQPGFGPPPGAQPGPPGGYGAGPQGGAPPGYGPPPGATPGGAQDWGQQPQPGQPQPGQPQPPAQPAQPPAQPGWGQQPQPPAQPAQPPAQPGWGQQPQPPAQPPSQPDQPGGSGQGDGGGFNPDATRTFRPEDLLPPDDPPRK